MAAKPYKCSLAGETVKVLVQPLVYRDEEKKMGHISRQLRTCSHVGNGECPVRAADGATEDVQGWGYSHTDDCEYLKRIRSAFKAMPDRNAPAR